MEGDLWTAAQVKVARARKTPVHQPAVQPGNRSTIVFVTVCTRGRATALADPNVQTTLIDAWKLATSWLVGRYTIMPDHVHLFAAPASYPPEPLHAWVRFWKSVSARKWPYQRSCSVWQVDFWDTQLRKGESYSAKWEYVRRNPIRAGLVEDAADWPYQGELNTLMWQDA